MSAAVRPDSWNFPLLLHVLGAMLLVGALILATSAFLLTWRGGSAPLVRLGYRAMLLGALASWILMRVGAEWTASKEGLTDANLSWLDIGSTTADGGLVLIIVARSWPVSKRAAPAVPRGAAQRSVAPPPSSSHC